VEKLVQQDVPELERRLTELQSQINRLSLSLHLWQERQDRLLEQRLTDWNAIEARAQKDASTRMHELQETIEHEWSALRQVQQDPNQYVRELGSNLGQKLSDLTDQVQAVVTELRANGSLRAQSFQAATPSWPLDDVVRLHNQLRDSPDTHDAGEQGLATRASLVLPQAPAELAERLETLERALSENPLENARSISTAWRAAVVLLAISIGVAGVLVSRLQGQVTAATARVSQAEQQAQVATKTATEQIAAAREEASQQIAQAREAAEKAQTISGVITAPDIVRFTLVGGDGTSSFSALTLWSRSRGLVFSESGLPALPKDSTYQIWLLSGAAAASVGTFIPDATGQFSMSTPTLPRVPQTVTGVLVTLERAGGNSAPTGRVVLTRPQPVPVAVAPTAPTP
jgi:DNA repair exonuclease SbcCD ATPase subunit